MLLVQRTLSDSQLAVQNGCVQSDCTEPVPGGSSDIPLQEGCKRDSLRQLIAVREQNYDESYQQYETDTGDEGIRRTKVMLKKQMDGNLRTKLLEKKDVLQVQLHRFQQTRDSCLLQLLVSKNSPIRG